MLERARATHGRTFLMRFGKLRFVVVHREEDIRRVLVSHRENYPKSVNYRTLKMVLGEGLLTSEGELWKRQRKLSQPAFHHQSIAGFADTMARCTQEMLERWSAAPAGRPFDVHEEMMRLTFRIVGLTLCSVDLDEDARAMGKAIHFALHYVNESIEWPFRIPPPFPTPRNVRFRVAMGRLERLIKDITAERRRTRETHHDLLGLLMSATDQEGAMSDRLLRDELLTLILAGHETTAVALSWTFALLAQHPDIARKLADEASRTLGDRPARFEDLPKLVYTGKVIDEALRLYPPAWIFERQALAEDVLDGYRIPPETIVGICPWTLHREREHFPDPLRFDPERFDADHPPPKFAYLPFGSGPRVCIGNQFALMEMKLVLAMIAARFRVTLHEKKQIEIEPAITLRPKHGIRIVAEPLRNAAPLRAAG